MTKKYRAKKGAWFGKEKAQIYGERLEELGKKENITAEVVVEDAKSISSPLHEVFDWDDKVEANQWRLHKARMLINHIEVEIITSNEAPRYVQANISLASQEGYMSATKVLSNTEYRMEWIRQALEEADLWQTRYHDYKELSAIFSAIDKTKKKLK